MKKLLTPVLVLSAALVAGTAPATPPSGFTGTTLSQGRYGAFSVRLVQLLPENVMEHFDDERVWASFQRTRGSSDLYVQSNVWAPGGTTGWHTHSGHSLITVLSGAITAYDGDDPDCTPHVYTAGMGFVDAGGTHIHVLRNEGTVEARTTAVQLIPAGAARRIDAAGNAACPF
jgi:predicted metal-dependent enzyme (double-stranded beta helix superfamily)